MITKEQLQTELLKAYSKINFLESELNQIKLILEGQNTVNNELNKAFKALKTEIKYAFEDLDNKDLDALYGTLLQISEITSNIYIKEV